MLKVNEIFYSIQGESSYAGHPCIFIRLTGCNIRCNYCDTTYAYEKGKLFSIELILEHLEHYNCGLVEITGGEPLMQSETSDLARTLIASGYTVLVESNGTLDIGLLPPGTHVIMDIKSPGSGVSEMMNWQNMDRLTDDDEVKLVLSDRADYEWARSIIYKYALHKRSNTLLSVVAGRLNPEDLAAWILEDELEVRLQLQMHKILWPNDEKGR
ncbi:radical SAM protein [bacterium]|nr:radical SAM protein [bacterium]